MKSNPTLLILDGLDEVPEKKLRTRVLDNVISFIDQTRDVLKGNVRVVATTRPYGYSEEFDPAHFLHLNLQKLLPEKALSYARLWTDAREPNPRESARIQDTFDTCIKDKVVNVLTQTPLQVTILLVIIRARGTPPKQREELFERYMDIIYQREQKKRPELLRTALDEIYGLHKFLAYILHTRAEKDKTAALMDVSEFKEKVKEYLIYTNPLLNEEEIETKVNQIITEASQRLVLIESPQEGKVGFGLTTTREFFAAAHLVDTARDTKERDSRFRVIARSPYWRNVALFFAGRVGRTRPGEAPSMIDVCREIDTERVDKFLKRGAELVMEIVDDRVLREPHNEIGAIQYGLTLLNGGLNIESDELLNRLKGLSSEYKERIIRPWIEDRLKKILPENIKVYVDICRELFGVIEPLHDAIKRASESDSKDVRLWALSQVIRDKIVEPWVIELLEELVDNISTESLVETLKDYWFDIKFYLNFPLSAKGRVDLAFALLAGIEEYGHRLQSLPSDVLDEISIIKPEGKLKENWLLFWAVCQLLILCQFSKKVENYRRYKSEDWSVTYILPRIANPNVKVWINKNVSFIRKFCETFHEGNDHLTRSLVALFEFFLEPYDLEKYIEIQKQVKRRKRHLFRSVTEVLSIFGVNPRDEEKLNSYHKELCTLYKHYKSEEQFIDDSKELNELMNKESKNIRNHPQKLLLWIDSNCDPIIEKVLDKNILNKVKTWLQYRNLSENALSLCWWSSSIVGDLELVKLVLEIYKKGLAEGQKRLLLIEPYTIAFYYWSEPKTKQELTIADQLKHIFEEVLANYSTLIDPEYRRLEIFYWAALCAGIVEERHVAELYKIFHNNPDFPSLPWLAENAVKDRSMLVNMLKSNNLEAARLAAVSLSGISQGIYFPHERKSNEEAWIGNKFWEFVQDKEDVWRPSYIKGMANCRLKWAELSKELIEGIKEASTNGFQNIWCRVIGEADYCDVKDRDALFELLLHILESEDTFAETIRFAALQRINDMVSDVEPIGFDEEPLNLPLSRRVRTSFSS
jgi:hypothetical protein